MTDTSTTYRLTAALLVVVFGLSWGASVLQACCTVLPAHCGTSVPVEHCEGEPGMAAAECAAHHARQDMRPAKKPTVEPSLDGTSFAVIRPVPALESRFITSTVSSQRTAQRAVRRHAHVGVWRE